MPTVQKESPIQIRENPLHSKQWIQCSKWILLISLLEIGLVTLLGLLASFHNAACDMIVMVLQVIAACVFPVFYYLIRKKKNHISKTAYQTCLACSAIHSIAVIFWFSFRLIAFYIPSTNNWYMLMWLPQVLTAYGILLFLLAIRPGKNIKYITDLEVQMIDGKANLWIHRHKTYSDILEGLVDQRYLFPVEELTTIRMGEGGDTLILEGNAKYMVWPFHMGDKPNYLTDIKDTRSDPARVVLHPKNDSETAKVAAFYNAIMQARSEL